MYSNNYNVSSYDFPTYTGNNTYLSNEQMYTNTEDRFFLGPFLVGGLAGTALGYGLANNNQVNRPPYPIYPPIIVPQPYPIYNTNYYY